MTYVPARNTLLLALLLGLAEVLHAADLFIGANAVDYSGYPDCRPQFVRAFEQLANEATRLGAFDFVEKPLSLAKLLRTVEAALESAGSIISASCPDK